MCDEASREQLERKDRSEKRLAAEGIPINTHLPAIESEAEVRRRSVEEIAFRALSLMAVAMNGAGQDKATTKKIIVDFGLAKWLSPNEKAFIADAKRPDRERIRFSWRVEAAHILFWALGYVDKLEKPTQQCDPHALMKIMKSRGAMNFIADAKFRSLSEVLDQADLIYRYQWAIVEDRIRGGSEPVGLNPSVAHERHTALNWLIGYMDQEWDDVSTDT